MDITFFFFFFFIFKGKLKTLRDDLTSRQNVTKVLVQIIHNDLVALQERVARESIAGGKTAKDGDDDDNDGAAEQRLEAIRKEFENQIKEATDASISSSSSSGSKITDVEARVAELVSKVKNLELSWSEERDLLVNRTVHLDSNIHHYSQSLSEEINDRTSLGDLATQALRTRLDSLENQLVVVLERALQAESLASNLEQSQEEIEMVQRRLAAHAESIGMLEVSLNNSLDIIDLLQNNHTKLVERSIGLIRSHLELLNSPPETTLEPETGTRYKECSQQIYSQIRLGVSMLNLRIYVPGAY